ncbi:MAG TPA: hypothetical protein VGQ75_08870 [Thermoanaerobaculia bacterium]|nr:hypothetical protein [Thermoanaerobaculia bacterium]
MTDRKRWKTILGVASVTGVTIFLLPTCRATRHTVARIVTPVPNPTEVFIPSEPAPTAAAATSGARIAPPTPTPTIAAMRVVTSAPPPRYERSPGVLYEELVPTVVAVTSTASPVATRAPRPTRTPTPGPSRKPGVYYEDAEGRPLPTPTP